MVLIKYKKFKVWGWQAFVNFTVGGMAAGFYILVVAIDLIYGGIPTLLHSSVIKLISPFLVALGFLAVATEAGKPARGFNLVNNMRTSWMSRETLAGVLFIFATVTDWLFPYIGFRVLAAAAAFGFLLSQGFIVYRCCATPSWNIPVIPVYFITSGFSMGFGLWLLLSGFGKIQAPFISVIVGLVMVMMTMYLWVVCSHRSGPTASRESSKLPGRFNSLIYNAGFGHVFAVLLLLALLPAVFFEFGAQYQRVMSILAATAILGTSASQKSKILLRFKYMRSIVMGQSGFNTQLIKNIKNDR